MDPWAWVGANQSTTRFGPQNQRHKKPSGLGEFNFPYQHEPDRTQWQDSRGKSPQNTPSRISVRTLCWVSCGEPRIFPVRMSGKDRSLAPNRQASGGGPVSRALVSSEHVPGGQDWTNIGYVGLSWGLAPLPCQCPASSSQRKPNRLLVPGFKAWLGYAY